MEGVGNTTREYKRSKEIHLPTRQLSSEATSRGEGKRDGLLSPPDKLLEFVAGERVGWDGCRGCPGRSAWGLARLPRQADARGGERKTRYELGKTLCPLGS